jgi:hypothetical protein
MEAVAAFAAAHSASPNALKNPLRGALLISTSPPPPSQILFLCFFLSLLVAPRQRGAPRCSVVIP